MLTQRAVLAHNSHTPTLPAHTLPHSLHTHSPTPGMYHRTLDRLRGVIPNLSLVVVTPGEDVPRGCAHHAVQGATCHVNHPLVGQRSHDSLRCPLVAVVTVPQTIVVTLTAGGGRGHDPTAATPTPNATEHAQCLPCVDVPVPGEGDGELGPTQHTSHPLSCQGVNLLWNAAPYSAANMLALTQ